MRYLLLSSKRVSTPLQLWKPLLGTNLLEFSIGRELGALKGLREQKLEEQPDEQPHDLGITYTFIPSIWPINSIGTCYDRGRNFRPKRFLNDGAP